MDHFFLHDRGLSFFPFIGSFFRLLFFILLLGQEEEKTLLLALSLYSQNLISS